MIRIGVLADTHLADGREERLFLTAVADRHFHDAALILHAGDIVDPGLLTVLLPVPVYAVRGNMDPATNETPLKRVVHIGGLSIGLVHGWGAPEGMSARLLAEFAGDRIDCLVYGHTHEPCCRWHDGLLLFNPGSATDRRRMPWESVGLLEIAEGKIRGRIIPLFD